MQTVGIPVINRNKNDGNNVERSQDASSNSRNATSVTQSRSTPSMASNQFNNNSKSTSLGNLSFINIVGLPYHPRQTSVPSTSSSRNQAIIPNHFRNASESNTTVPPRPPRTINSIKNSGIDNTNKQIIDLNEIKPCVIPEIGLKEGQNVTGTWNNQSGGTGKGGSTASHCRDGTRNVSNIDVNFYRAMPTTISSVPTIECLNINSKNVSNVQIMPLSGSTTDQNSCPETNNNVLTVEQTSTQPSTSNSETVSSVYLRVPPSSSSSQRTFISTEAQTDDTSLSFQNETCGNGNKERRRRERRERRQNRRANPVRPSGDIATQTTTIGSTALPDILDSHLPPPYTTHPNTLQRSQPHPHRNLGMIPPQLVVAPSPQMVSGGVVSATTPQALPTNLLGARQTRSTAIVPNSVPHVSFPPPNLMPGQVPLVQNVPDANSRFRFALPVGQYGRDHFSDDEPKNCCGILTWKPGSLKWLIASIALVAIGCVLVGTALGTMRPVGRDHITLALLMIGIGIVLVTISGVAWRLASQNATSCRTMLGLGSLESVEMCTRRFVPRLPPSYGRPHHPYAAMMYPEFQYRPPPPSYQASMQEYRLRLLLIDRGNTPQIQAGTQSTVSPPPTYRSHAGSLMRDRISTRTDVAWSEYSCPPSYRSQTYSTRLGTIQGTVSVHTRDPSLSISEQTNDHTIDVVNILRNSEEDVRDMNVDVKTTDETSTPYKLILSDCGSNFESNKEENLVTIVQTDDRNPVIVTVSGNTSNTDNIGIAEEMKSPSEIQILAHL